MLTGLIFKKSKKVLFRHGLTNIFECYLNGFCLASVLIGQMRLFGCFPWLDIEALTHIAPAIMGAVPIVYREFDVLFACKRKPILIIHEDEGGR